MARNYNYDMYDYGTSPRKLQPEYTPNRQRKSKNLSQPKSKNNENKQKKNEKNKNTKKTSKK